MRCYKMATQYSWLQFKVLFCYTLATLLSETLNTYHIRKHMHMHMRSSLKNDW